MADGHEALRIAVGLARRSIELLDSGGQPAAAGRMRDAIEMLMESNRWLRDQELHPNEACLIAAIPLDAGSGIRGRHD